LYPPTSVRYAPRNVQGGGEGHVLFTTGSNQLSIWDTRTPRGCQTRINVGNGTLLALATIGTSEIAVGGTDRTLFVFDVRKRSQIHRIPGIVKYEITAIRPSQVNTKAVYVTSLDHEIAMIDYTRKSASHMARQGLRGDSRWVGVDVVPETMTIGSSGVPATEDFVGVTDTGRFYVIRDAWRMMQPR